MYEAQHGDVHQYGDDGTMKYKVTDRATGEVRYLTSEELARMPARAVEHVAPREARAPRTIRHWPEIPADLKRDTAIKLIREALKKRSGKQWSVTGGRGTGWGWIHIDAPPARRTYDSEGNPGGHYTSPAERAELSRLLGTQVHHQGESIPASSDHYREYIERARGIEPTKIAEAYWD